MDASSYILTDGARSPQIEDARNDGFVDFTLTAGLLSTTASTTEPNILPVHYIGTFTPPTSQSFLTPGPWPLLSNINASPPVFCAVVSPGFWNLSSRWD